MRKNIILILLNLIFIIPAYSNSYAILIGSDYWRIDYQPTPDDYQDACTWWELVLVYEAANPFPPGGVHTVDVSGLPAGAYFAMLRSEAGEIITQQLIILR